MHLCALLAPLPRNNCKEASVLRLFVVEQGEDTEQERIRGWTKYKGKVPRGWVYDTVGEYDAPKQAETTHSILPRPFCDIHPRTPDLCKIRPLLPR